MSKKRGWRASSGFIPKGQRTSRKRPILNARAFSTSLCHDFFSALLAELEEDPLHAEGMQRFTEHLGFDLSPFGARWSSIAHNPKWPLLRAPKRSDSIPPNAGVLLVPQRDAFGRFFNLTVVDWNKGEYSFCYPE